MRVLCAPDKFKQACTAAQAAEAMARGVTDAGATPVIMPLADGGEGTVRVLAGVFPDMRTARVQDALGREVEATFALTTDGMRALVESSQACGLWRIEEADRNPLKTHTYGVGQLMLAAIDAGARELLVSLGGSATSDGGLGMLVALGARATNMKGGPAEYHGASLFTLDKLDLNTLDPRLKGVKLTALCDVQTRLLGPEGSSRKFVVQKGGTTRAIDTLEAGLEVLTNVAGGDPHAPGTGAAGGLGYALSLLGATLLPGAAAILDALKFDEVLKDVDVVFTGEGTYDVQTADGKLIAALASRCKAAAKPLVVFAGVVKTGFSIEGVTAAYGISPHGTRLQDCLNETETNLQRHTHETAQLLAAQH